MRRLLAWLMLFALALLWQAPATLIDRSLSRATGDALRLAEARGTVWSGQAVVARSLPGAERWRPQMPVEWRFDAARLLDKSLAWRISSGGVPVAVVGVGTDGFFASDLHLRGPASMFVDHLPHSLAHAGWRGEVDLQATSFGCTWVGHCAGRASLLWNGASTDLLPGWRLGDYRLTTEGVPGKSLRFRIRTVEGLLRIEGEGDWGADGALSFQGTVKGEPSILQRLPSIAGPWVRPTDDPGTWAISIVRGANAPARP